MTIAICSYAQAQYTQLASLTSSVNGSYPQGSLFSDGTYLYGMTSQGGANNLGTIFKILPDGTGFVKLLDFNGTSNGSYPKGSLISDGTFLYGMTSDGGIDNKGTIFKILTDGSGYVKLLDFDGSTYGSFPQASLYFDGTYLYGTTQNGGTNGIGTIFKILPNGSGFQTLKSFSGALNGLNPVSTLVSDGSYLYGITKSGGLYTKGTLFKIMPDGTNFLNIVDFNDGALSLGSLIYEGSYLYGMTNEGGANNLGIIYKVMTDGTNYTKLMDFNHSTSGGNPNGNFVSDGNYLYAMARIGGPNNFGNIFKIKHDGTGYVKLLDFTGTINGNWPEGSLIMDNTYLYGMTTRGGNSNHGTIFKFQHCTSITANATSTSICIGNSVTLSGNGATTYTWSGGITNGMAFTPTTSSTYTLQGSGIGTCPNSSTVHINVNSLPTLTVNNGVICSGESFAIIPSGALTYTYSSGTNVVTPTINTTYSVSGKDANGCLSSMEALSSVTVNTLPTILASTSNTLLCTGQTASITASGANSYSWSTSETNTVISVSPSTQTTYTLTGTDINNCSNTITFTQNVSTCTGNDDLTSSYSNSVVLYPNPNNGVFYVETGIKATIVLFNALGDELLNEELEIGKHVIKQYDLANGIYFIKIISENSQSIKRVLINR